MSCKGCIYIKKAGNEHPCSECNRLVDASHRVDHYTMQGEMSKLVMRKVDGKFKLVNKGNHYGIEVVK